MEIGDENLPPSSHSWTENSSCTSPRSTVAVRSILGDVNTSVNEVKTSNNEVGSGAAGEEEKCEAVSADQEAEAWSERTAVITRYDHETHCHLARSFVEDLADKVVADSLNKESNNDEDDSKPSLNAKKQQLFLPDLVPNLVVSGPNTAETISESDEYESADEQPQLHETLYLDSTVHPSTGVNASTPIDTPGWHLDFDSSRVLHVADVTVDASLKDYSLPVIDQALESLSLIPLAPEGVIAPPEETDSVGAIKSFPARTTQPFSPSSGSDVEVSVVESEADTLAAATSNNPCGEVDVELITQFERLVLGKQGSLEKSPVLNTTFPADNNLTAPVNETASLVYEDEDLIPANATRDVLSPTQGPVTSNQDESELATPFTDQSSCVEPESLLEVTRPPVSSLDFQGSSDLQEAHPATEEPLNEVEEQPQTEESPATEESSNLENQSSAEEQKVVENPAPVPAEVTTSEVDTTAEDESTVVSTAEQTVLNAADKSNTTESTETVPASTSESFNNKTPAEESGTNCEENTVAESVSESTVDTDSKVEINFEVNASSEIAVETVSETNVDSEVATEASTADEIPDVVTDPVSSVETPSSEPEATIVKPTSLPEEKPIVPKKGYDLSFLDRFDNLENATPSISQAKLLPLLADSSIKDSEAEPEQEQPTQEQQQVETAEPTETQEELTETIPEEESVVPQEESTVPQEETENPEISTSETPANTTVTTTQEEENTVEEQKEEPTSQSTVIEQAIEEPLIAPKKGYDLSFLDKLDDLENASPFATTNGSQKPAMKESMSTKESNGDSTDEQPSQEAKSEKPAGSSPAKKGPAVRKPIRPRVARPAATAKPDAFEVEFTFDPNDDPFKSKKKLDASPTRDGSPKTQSDANTTIQVDNVEANDTVIESIPESEKDDMLGSRLSNENSDQEEFRPAQEVFHDPSELDFLMQHGGAPHDIALARQSLFVKFDPLVTGRPSMFPSRPSDGGGADETILAEDTNGRRLTSESLFLFSPPHSSGAPKVEKTEPVEKAAQPESVAPSRTITGDVLSLNEHKEALKLQELLFQDKLLQKEREILIRENENQEIKSKLEATAEAQAQMRQIVGEYEKTISQLIAEKEREKANMETTLQNTIKERDQAIEDLKEVERAFSEFHRMYERNRAAAENLHKNEEALKKALAAYQERLQQEQHKYETLKLHAAQKLEGAQQEMENLKRNLEAESSRVKAQLKKTEMRLASVEQSLEQKTKENEELTTLCDELINKLGSSAK